MKRPAMIAGFLVLFVGSFRILKSDASDAKDWSIFLPEDSFKAQAVSSCSSCHGLEQIVISRGNNEFWSDTVWTMVSHGADFPRDQAEALIKYFSASLDPAKAKLSLPVNLNTASIEVLRLFAPLASHAEDIIKVRAELKSFEKAEDLLKVNGITKQDLDRVRPFIVVNDTGGR